jgi:hypothetical protein
MFFVTGLISTKRHKIISFVALCQETNLLNQYLYGKVNKWLLGARCWALVDCLLPTIFLTPLTPIPTFPQGGRSRMLGYYEIITYRLVPVLPELKVSCRNAKLRIK